MKLWEFLMAVTIAWGSIEFLIVQVRKHKRRKHPDQLTIIGASMANPKVGTPFLFTVQATKAGVVVPDTNITATSDNGTATINPDGSGGTVTPVNAGPMNLTATDGKLTATPLALTVDPDLTPDTLTIIPS